MKLRLLHFLALALLLTAAAPAPASATLRRLDAPDDSSRDTASGAAPTSAPDATNHHQEDTTVFGYVVVEPNETVDGDAVAVFGGMDMKGRVRHDAVCVFGDSTINGPVDHDVVCIFGDLTLGPKARIGHDVVCQFGDLHRDPAAVIGGKIEHGGGPHFRFDHPGVRNWWDHGLSHGRFLLLGPHLFWLWSTQILLIGLYVLIALIAPKQTARCGDLLVERPGLVFICATLGLLAVPIIFALLCITIIGIPIAVLLLPIEIALPTLFGKASLYCLIGRKISSGRAGPALAVVLGALVCLLFLMLPVIGLALVIVAGFLGWGMGIAALLTARQKPVAAGPGPVVFGGIPPAGAAAATVAAAAIEPIPMSSAPPPLSSSLPPPVPPVMPAMPVSALPRAGFWIRTGALVIDMALIGILCGMMDDAFHHPGGGFFLVLLAAYGAVLWKVKGSTVGGIICNLTVVRVDGRPVDWSTAIVRALGCFISFFALGLGFIWVVFDSERQSWHDKIAGTTVVRPHSRQSLV